MCRNQRGFQEYLRRQDHRTSRDRTGSGRYLAAPEAVEDVEALPPSDTLQGHAEVVTRRLCKRLLGTKCRPPTKDGATIDVSRMTSERYTSSDSVGDIHMLHGRVE